MPPLRPPKVKQYVDVVCRINDTGRIDPLIVCWPDGRSFHVDRAGGEISIRSVSPLNSEVTAYNVHMKGKPVTLYLENQGPHASALIRWYVLIPEGQPAWKYGLDAGRGLR